MDFGEDDDEFGALVSIFGEADVKRVAGEVRVRLDDRGRFGSDVWLRCLAGGAFDVTSCGSRLDSERTALAEVATAAATPGEPSIYAAAIAANEALADLADDRDDVAPVVSKSESLRVNNAKKTLRCVVYSHHIVAQSKRDGLRRLSQALGVTMLLKVGWPGVIVLEGAYDDVRLFVDEIHKWRWKHLVVRGEQEADERTLPPKANAAFLDMAAIARTCADYGLDDLFQRVFRRN